MFWPGSQSVTEKVTSEDICFQETGGLNLKTRKINTNDALDQEQQISIHTCSLYGWSHERCWEDRISA